MIDRIMGIFKLDAGTFDAIEHDELATSQAALVVLAVALFSGVGGLFGALIGGSNLVTGFFGPIIYTLAGWIVWSAVVFIVGSSMFGGTTNMREMMRVVGFAYAPQLLGLLSFIPCVGWFFALAGWIWSLAAMVVAIRQGLDIDTGKALITALVGWILVVVINILVGMFFGGMTAIGSVFGG